LAVLRQGAQVTLVSRPENEPGIEYSLTIDWQALDNSESVDEVELDVKRRKSALLAYSAIAIFIFTMFAIALSVALNAGIVGTIALMLFLFGTGVWLVGIFFTATEIRTSHRALCYDVNQITSLKNLY